MISVNHTFLPPKEELLAYIDQIWDGGVFTINGGLIREFEEQLKKYLGVKHLLLVSNGTMALQLALRAIAKPGGEVLTTPFSFIATSSSILWEGLKPVFSDIDPDSLCLDPNQLEAKITENTCAILPTHVFGNVCDIEAIDKIAAKYKLPVIYDGAHAFGSTWQGKSVFRYGDVSCLSLQAYKILQMVEGGALITENNALAETFSKLRTFGKSLDNEIETIGINAKSSEIHAAIGLCNLKEIDSIFSARKEIGQEYDRLLQGLPMQKPQVALGASFNYSYYPILLKNEQTLLKLKAVLFAEGVKARRYFHPSLNRLDFMPDQSPMPISESAASRVLCLPIYKGLKMEEVRKIGGIIQQELG